MLLQWELMCGMVIRNTLLMYVIPDFTKPDIEDQWNQARQLEDAMVAEIFDSSVCACCGHRFPHSDMQIGLTDTARYGTAYYGQYDSTTLVQNPSQIQPRAVR